MGDRCSTNFSPEINSAADHGHPVASSLYHTNSGEFPPIRFALALELFSRFLLYQLVHPGAVADSPVMAPPLGLAAAPSGWFKEGRRVRGH
jgi:hypothetical protein